MLSIILAQAYALLDHYGRTPILLLDEIPAHLDNHKKEQLYQEIMQMGMQVWMTGTERGLFKTLENDANFFTCSPDLVDLS